MIAPSSHDASAAGGEDRHAARRQLALLFAAFLPLFVGPGALQLHLSDLYRLSGRVVISKTAFLAISYGSMGVSRLLVGWTVRWVGDRAALIIGAGGYALFAIAQWPGLNRWWLVVVAMAFGFGGTWVWLVGGATVLDLSRRAAFGRGVGILYGCSAFAQGVGVLVLGLLITNGHPRTAVVLAAGWGLMAVAVFALRRPAAVKRAPPSAAALLRFAADRRLIIVGVFLMVGSLPFGLILGAFRDHVHGLGAPVWLVVPCFFLARAGLAVTGGQVVDRLGRGRTLAIAFAIGAAALFAVPWMEATAGLAVAALMMGLEMSLIPVAGTALVGDITSSPDRPMALGVLFFWRDAGAVTGLLGGAALAAHLGPGGRGFPVFAAVLAVFALLSLTLSRWAGRPVGGKGTAA